MQTTRRDLRQLGSVSQPGVTRDHDLPLTEKPSRSSVCIVLHSMFT